MFARWKAGLLRWINASLLRAYPPVELDGIRVHGPQSGVERLRRAIALLREHDPVRHRRVVRSIPVIGSSEFGSHLDPDEDVFWFDFRATASQLADASTLVNGATRARLRRRIPYRGELREVVERLCLRQQRRFFVAYASSLAGEERTALLEGFDAHAERLLASRWWEQQMGLSGAAEVLKRARRGDPLDY